MPNEDSFTRVEQRVGSSTLRQRLATIVDGDGRPFQSTKATPRLGSQPCARPAHAHAPAAAPLTSKLSGRSLNGVPKVSKIDNEKDFVDRVAGQIATIPGVVAATLGGSRADGTPRSDSDWDFGLYYRGELTMAL